MASLRQSIKITFIFLKRNLLVLLGGIILGVILFSFRTPLKNTLSTFFPSQVKVGVLGKYEVSSLPEEITNLISFGLTTLSTNSTPQKGAALSWEIKEQGKQYVFHLDPLLHWQDGSSLKSKEIKVDIEGAKLTHPDQYTLVVDLEKTFAPLPALLINPLLKKNLIGLGDYQIKKIHSNAGYITLLILQATRKGITPKQITFRFYPDQQDLLTAFKLGEINCVKGLDSVEPLRAWGELDIAPKKESDSRYVALFFNTQKDPFSDKRFRQALAYGFEKPEEGTRAFSPFSPLSWAYNPNVKTYPFDPERGQNILKNMEAQRTSIQITTTFDLADWAEKIKEDWEKNLGVQTNLKILPFISRQEDFDIILGYGLIPPDPDQYPFWHTDQPGNITKFSNPRVDKLLEEGRATLNKDERKDIYHDFQRFLLEELPAIFLFHPTTYEICRSDT